MGTVEQSTCLSLGNMQHALLQAECKLGAGVRAQLGGEGLQSPLHCTRVGQDWFCACRAASARLYHTARTPCHGRVTPAHSFWCLAQNLGLAAGARTPASLYAEIAIQEYSSSATQVQAVGAVGAHSCVCPAARASAAPAASLPPGSGASSCRTRGRWISLASCAICA